MEVSFREVDPFNCWIWLKFADVPGKGEIDYINGVFDSWYVIGRLGGFNSENMQTHEMGSDVSWMNYENDIATGLPSLMHNLGEFEFNGCWARCWVDLGTADLISIDILINTLKQMDVDVVQIDEVIVGGVNQDWPVEDHPDTIFPSKE